MGRRSGCLERCLPGTSCCHSQTSFHCTSRRVQENVPNQLSSESPQTTSNPSNLPNGQGRSFYIVFAFLHPSLFWQIEHNRNHSSGGQETHWFHTTRNTQGTTSLCIHTQLPLPARAQAISSPNEKATSTECKDYSLLELALNVSSEHIIRFFFFFWGKTLRNVFQPLQEMKQPPLSFPITKNDSASQKKRRSQLFDFI